MKRKCLAVGIILLFIGVAFAPSINFTVVKASNDNDLIEVTSQTCGIQGFGNTTVKLTKEQYHDLEQYLVDFRARLNQTSTREEAVPIFKDAVMELNKYGLLPKGMSVELVQQLLFNYINHKYVLKNPDISKYGNFLSLIAGRLNPITFRPTIIFLIIYFIFSLGQGYLFLILLYAIYSLIQEITNSLPFSLNSLIFTPTLTYAYGWLHTIGLLGNKNWSGNLTGSLPLMDGLLVFGFIGLKLNLGDSQFFIGSALTVGVEQAKVIKNE